MLKRKFTIAFCGACFLFQRDAISSAVPPASSSKETQCSASQLSLSLDAENGYFNGMSHSGTLLVFRNLGPQTCSVPARPVVHFEDAHQRPVSIKLKPQPGMHPGPVLRPVAVPVQAEVTSELRWVSGDVFDGHNCLSPAYLTVAIGSEQMRVKFAGSLCGPAGESPTFSMTPLQRDPVYVPGANR